MNFVRALFRLPLILLLTVSVALLHQISRALCFGNAGRRMAARGFWMGLWGRLGLRILGARIVVEGRAPRAPFLFVSNHLSYLDILLLSAELPAIHFVSKAEVRDWPLLGPVATAGQTIYLQRDRWRDLPLVVDDMRGVLADGGGIAFFPEATTSGGADLLPFRGALFEAPVRTGYEVLCGSICYETPEDVPAASESICWWRDMPLPGHFWGLLGLRRFDARLRFSTRPQRGADRKELAGLCRQEIGRIFRVTTQAEHMMADFAEVLHLNRSLLEGLSSLLRELSAEAYGGRRADLKSEGIGSHVRHVLDFYSCLLDQLPGGRIDYDRRARETEVERDPVVALARIDHLLERLAQLRTDSPLFVAHDYPEGADAFADSSLLRELRFVASHAVHHFAIVALLLRKEGHDVDSDFGVAPSTLEYLRRADFGPA